LHLSLFPSSPASLLLFLIFYLNFINGIPAGAYAEESVCFLKFISQLLEALEKLRDYLLDDTTWPVIMQWFDEDENK